MPQPPPSGPALGRKQQVLVLIGLGGAALAVAGLVSLGSVLHSAPAAAARPAERGLFRPTADQWKSLTVAPVALRDFDQIEIADGKIEADGDRTTQVASPFSGRVVQVFAEAGQTVAARQPLFAVAAAEAVQGRNDLQAALGALATAQAQLALAKETETRQAELVKTAGGALKDSRQATSDRIAAEGQVRSAEAALGAARSKLAVLGESDKDIAALEHAPAAQAVNAQAIVYAPVAGVVTRRALGPGQVLAAGGDPVFAVSDLSTVWLSAQVRESDAAKVKLGATAYVTIPAWPGRRFMAKVTYVAPALDPDTRRLPVRAAIANPDGALKPEMFARFSIDSGLVGRSPATPESAVIREGDTARVWVASAGGDLRIRPVVTGVVQDGMVQIRQGLVPGDRVVTKGALFIDQAGEPD